MRARLTDESGSGLITGVIVIGALLVPLLFLVQLFAQIERAHLASEQAARDGVRAAALAPTAGAAQAAADAALSRARARAGDFESLGLTLSGDWQRGSVLRTDARATVRIGRLPGLGSIGRITVRAHARAPVDRYRSLTGPAP